jgi:hypothetical protein
LAAVVDRGTIWTWTVTFKDGGGTWTRMRMVIETRVRAREMAWDSSVVMGFEQERIR